jgi:VWFA-related protein
MPRRTLSWMLPFSIVVAALSAAGATGQAPATAAKTIFVTVVDKSGQPQKDMTAAEFQVKEGGKVVPFEMKPATTPMRIALIDSDAGTGAYQQGILTFMNRVLGRAEMAVTEVVIQPQRLVDYTADVAALSNAVSRLGRRGPTPGGQLIDAIYDAAKDVAAAGKRPVIVVMRVGGEGTGGAKSKEVRAELRKSGATLYAVAIQGADRQPLQVGGANGQNMAAQARQVEADEANDGMNNLQTVLGDGSAETGGHYDTVVTTNLGLSKGVEQIALELLNSYELTYTLPAGVKPSDKLQVTTTRKDMKVYAPTRPPM